MPPEWVALSFFSAISPPMRTTFWSWLMPPSGASVSSARVWAFTLSLLSWSA